MSMTDRNPYLVALGANLADGTQGKAQSLQAALDGLRTLGMDVTASRFWRTPAYPPGSGPDFVNACAVVSADLDPQAMLRTLHEIESQMGRRRQGRWGPRLIDMDLLACGDLVLPDAATVRHWIGLSPQAQRSIAPERLILPHPRLQDRAFVLVPLCEVAPDWRHPLLGRTVAEMAAVIDPAERAALNPL
jgi:2-amino-4-hydroxy-6-hydroxymethyldihydropteridine diphosphokinase